MPVKRIKVIDIPMATRNRQSPLKLLQEWADVQAVLVGGLKPKEAVELTLSQNTLEKLRLKNATRLFAMLIKKKVRELKLEYDVWQQGGPNGKTIYIAGR